MNGAVIEFYWFCTLSITAILTSFWFLQDLHYFFVFFLNEFSVYTFAVHCINYWLRIDSLLALCSNVLESITLDQSWSNKALFDDRQLLRFMSVCLCLWLSRLFTWNWSQTSPQKPSSELSADSLLSAESLQSCGMTMGLISPEPTENWRSYFSFFRISNPNVSSPTSVPCRIFNGSTSQNMHPTSVVFGRRQSKAWRSTWGRLLVRPSWTLKNWLQFSHKWKHVSIPDPWLLSRTPMMELKPSLQATFLLAVHWKLYLTPHHHTNARHSFAVGTYANHWFDSFGAVGHLNTCLRSWSTPSGILPLVTYKSMISFVFVKTRWFLPNGRWPESLPFTRDKMDPGLFVWPPSRPTRESTSDLQLN